MEEEIETKEKQEYLRINILEKGYNADEFMDYLQALRGEKGLEIQNWSKNDLVKAVLEFIRIKNVGKEENIFENEEKKNIKINENNSGNNDIKNDNNIQNIDVNNNNNYNNILIGEEYLKCKSSEITELSSKKNVEIIVSDPETKEGGIFSKSYVTYLVTTKPFNFQVRRRFSEFEWLRNILMSQYINCIIPPLYKKTYFMGINDYIITKRMRILNKFMNEILSNPLLENSQIFYDFITIKDSKEFSNKKNAYEKLYPPEKGEEIKTLTGEINIGFDNKKDAITDRIKVNSENNEELMKKITKEYKILNNNLNGVVSQMRNIMYIWDELYKRGNKNLEGEAILGIYDVMAKFMEDWAKMEETQIKLINEKIREYFRYIKNEYKCIKEYYNVYDNAKNKFIAEHIKLIDQKEYLFENEDIKNWGLDPLDAENKILLMRNKDYAMSKMLPEETKKVSEIRKLYGIYLNSLIDEYNNIQFINKVRHKENILIFIKETIENITNFHVSLNNLIAYIDIMKEDEFIDG